MTKIHEMRGLYLEFDGKDLIVSGRLPSLGGLVQSQ